MTELDTKINDIRKTQNKGKESENSYQKLKRLRDYDGQAHEHTHGNKIEIFRRTQLSFSIRRERMYASTRQRWHH